MREAKPCQLAFSSPVRKYRKSYCSHPGVGVRVAQMLKFLARLHKVHRAIAVTPVVHVRVRVPVRVTKFSRSPYLDNHSSESIHTWTIDTL